VVPLFKKLRKLQNRAARVVTNSSNDQSSLPLISQLGWLALREIVYFEKACTVYKVLKGLAPPCMKSMFHVGLSPAIESYATSALTLKFHYMKPLKGSTAFSIEESLFLLLH